MNQSHPRTPFAPAEEIGSGGYSPASTMTETKSTAAQTARDAASRVKSMAAETTTKAKERIGGYSNALHESAKAFEGNDPNIAWFTHRMGDRVQGVADYLRDRDLDGLRSDAEDVARRHPALFFGGLFVAGLLCGNLIKASRRNMNSGMDSTSAPDWSSGQGMSPPLGTSQAPLTTLSDTPQVSGM